MDASLRKLLLLISVMNPSGQRFFAPKSQGFLQNKTLQEKHSGNNIRAYDPWVAGSTPNSAQFKRKQALTVPVFIAGAGFEPATFGL